MAKPMEGLEEVLLNNSRHERTTRIDTLASPPVRQVLIAFLRENQDVFAWSHEDMPRIDPLVVHKLNVSLSFLPHPSEEAGIRVRAKQGHNGKGSQVTRIRVHTRSILP